MCEICGHRVCPAACPNGKRPPEFECANCGDEVFDYEAEEILEDGTCICETCAAFVDDEVLDMVRIRHQVPLTRQIRRWAGQ